MAKPYHHALKNVKRWGGKPEDYLPIHDKMDSSKAHVADMRHRVIYHNSLGIFMMEEKFGTFILNSDGRKVQVRDIAEQHILDDLGFIPTIQDWLDGMTLEPWMTGSKRVNKYPHVD